MALSRVTPVNLGSDQDTGRSPGSEKGQERAKASEVVPAENNESGVEPKPDQDDSFAEFTARLNLKRVREPNFQETIIANTVH